MAPDARGARQHYVVLPVVLSAILAAGLPAGTTQAVSPPLDLYVANGGSDQRSECRESTHPCRTLQHAVDVASGPVGADRDVVIHLGPGTYIPRDGGVHVFAGSLTSLSIVGAGPAATVLHTPLPNTHEVVALTVAAGFVKPVRVESLRITGHGFDGAKGSGAGGSYVTGIKDAGSGPLRVTDVRIDRLRGGQGASAKGSSGGDGGSVYGIDRTGGPTELLRTSITDLRGGDAAGSGARAAKARRHGGQGGSAIGVNTDGALRVVAGSISDLRGGAGGVAADGGSAYSAAVQGVAGATSAEFVDSELSGNVGGSGGPGLVGRAGAPGGQGGQGGDAVGVTYLGPRLAVETSTLSGHRGGRGGAGGAGGPASAYLPGGGGGRGGDGGAAMGALATTPDLVATASLVDSTLSGNRAGAGGAGGAGGVGARHRSGIGGDGGDGGTAAGAGLLAGPTATLTSSAVHVTAAGNLGAPGGAAGRSGGAAGKRSATAAGLVSNAPITLAASLLDNGSSRNCLLLDAPLIDAGWNVAADDTCFRAGTGSRVVPEIGAGLAALADNGGLTRTSAVAPDSPAATAVSVLSGLCAGTFGTDQRGAPRPGRGGPHTCAAGAFEPA